MNMDVAALIVLVISIVLPLAWMFVDTNKSEGGNKKIKPKKAMSIPRSFP